MANIRKSGPDLSTLPRHIIKQGHWFINSHSGEKIHEDRIVEWLPKPAQNHEDILEKRWDLR
jgi:hypothetical protein